MNAFSAVEHGLPRAEAIERLFSPRSVAIIGASTDPRKWGYMAAEQALRDADCRQVHLVNARGGAIMGQPCLTTIGELPDDVDLAIVTVPLAALESSIESLLQRGVRTLVTITAGLGEGAESGRQLERRIVANVRAHGAVMVGPNCMGVYDGHAPFRCMPWAEIPPGPIGFISQSGGLIMDLSTRLAEVGLGLSRAVSVGNQADVTILALLRNLADHEPTRVIAIYCEAPLEGRALLAEIHRITEAGKPVLVLTPESGQAARRAARSHTASLVGDRRLVWEALSRAGALCASSPRELCEMLQALVPGLSSQGRRAAVVSDTGGPVVLAAGEVERAGFSVPRFSDGLTRTLSSLLTERAVVHNPIDLVDNLNAEPAIDVLATLLASDEVDVVLMILHAFVHDTPDLEVQVGRRLAEQVHAARKPVAFICRSLALPGVRALLDAGMPVYRDAEAAARGLALMTMARISRQPPESPLSCGAPSSAALMREDYISGRQLLEQFGIPLPVGGAAEGLNGLQKLAATLGYPVVLKNISLRHKSADGGVALGLADDEALSAAFERMSTRDPGARWYVEQCWSAPMTRELLVTGRNDPHFGPVAVLGMGGTYAEIFDDVTTLLLPADTEEIRLALSRLRAGPMLLGCRGGTPLAIEGLHQVLAALTRLLCSHPDLGEIEVNPLAVSPSGLAALDVRLSLASEALE
jgi:acetate---CoA ligase (ADP-forming)